ncbi:MAG TPA: phosphopantetheine-binding protein [Actinophytocola sp.]|uniref:phosphopantetheine-binding protein n=1 Tax=Actinophytocola sp. TaxID=1872138 RepID=UPI002DBBE9CC|nr:phosphopantetheine-binding protein [Actinophytocola sp.]HEU5471249.1 phosphopantetheine-binding protein [Actinophytocola sp.]
MNARLKRLGSEFVVNSDDVANRVRKIMVEVLDLPRSPDDIGFEISLYSPQIQLDSLHLLQLLVAVEEEFGGRIDDEDVMDADLRTVGDLVALVRQHIAAEETA